MKVEGIERFLPLFSFAGNCVPYETKMLRRIALRQKGESRMDEIRRIKRELAYKGVILNIYKDYMSLPNGRTAIWDFVEHKGAAAVVPVTEEGKILMVRQYRNALERYTLEVPAGALNDVGEPKDICAARELEEETGYRAGTLEWLININTTVAFLQ